MSDCGRVRTSNEDCFVVAELSRTLNIRHTNLPQSESASSCHRAHALLVADGVGGGNAGEVASGLSVQTIEDFLLNSLRRFSNLQAGEEDGALHALQAALVEADSRLFDESAKHPEWLGMGTTLTLAFAVNWRLFVAHAGDSRCYIRSNGSFRQLTHDHTMTAEMIRHGLLLPENQANHPYRHVVTNLLGGSVRGVRVELHSIELRPGDVILLCSDGLTEMISDNRLEAILKEGDEPRCVCERLLAEANDAGGRDNITVVAARVASSGCCTRLTSCEGHT